MYLSNYESPVWRTFEKTLNRRTITPVPIVAYLSQNSRVPTYELSHEPTKLSVSNLIFQVKISPTLALAYHWRAVG